MPTGVPLCKSAQWSEGWFGMSWPHNTLRVVAVGFAVGPAIALLLGWGG